MAFSLSSRAATATPVSAKQSRVARAGRAAVLPVYAAKKEAVVVLTGTAGVSGTVTFSQDGESALQDAFCPNLPPWQNRQGESCHRRGFGGIISRCCARETWKRSVASLNDVPTFRPPVGATTVKGKITGLKAGLHGCASSTIAPVATANEADDDGSL